MKTCGKCVMFAAPGSAVIEVNNTSDDYSGFSDPVWCKGRVGYVVDGGRKIEELEADKSVDPYVVEHYRTAPRIKSGCLGGAFSSRMNPSLYHYLLGGWECDENDTRAENCKLYKEITKEGGGE